MKTMQNPAGFRTVFTGSTGINLKQQNRTDHLLQKPDIFICYRQAIVKTIGMSQNAPAEAMGRSRASGTA